MKIRPRILIPWEKFPPFSKDRIGGVSVVLWELSRALAKRGAKIDVVVPGSEATEEIEGVRVFRGGLGWRLMRNQKLNSDDKRFLIEHDRILSIQNFSSRSLVGAVDRSLLVRQIHNVIAATTLAQALTLKPSWLERLRAASLREKFARYERKLSGTKTICVSNFLLDLMIKLDLEAKENLVRIPNGVDTNSFRPLKREKIYDIAFVGNFYWVKGLDVLLQSLRILNQRGLQLRVALAGRFTGSQSRFLLYGLGKDQSSKVRFLQVVSRTSLPELINSSKLVVIPSRYETFGMVALESIACGVPVVASRVGGLPEILNEDVSWLVSNLDGSSLAEAILSALNEERLQEDCIDKGPELAKEYHWEKIADRTLGALA
jgi:glycosyltransferase involved in cell wall biosynthesis